MDNKQADDKLRDRERLKSKKMIKPHILPRSATVCSQGRRSQRTPKVTNLAEERPIYIRDSWRARVRIWARLQEQVYLQTRKHISIYVMDSRQMFRTNRDVVFGTAKKQHPHQNHDPFVFRRARLPNLDNAKVVRENNFLLVSQLVAQNKYRDHNSKQLENCNRERGGTGRPRGRKPFTLEKPTKALKGCISKELKITRRDRRRLDDRNPIPWP